ncbi:MAG TPA: hypothetical protein VIK86_00045, partial [Candidatus Paceibacterota bacterium]
MNRKVLSIALTCAILIITFLSACGSKSDSTAKSVSNETSSTQSSQATETTAAKNVTVRVNFGETEISKEQIAGFEKE